MTQALDDKFIEALGLIWQAEGGPRIAGQVMAYLILADGPSSLTEIAEGLGVSKASVSTNVRLLELRGMTVRVSRKGARGDLWEAVPHPQGATLLAMADRFDRNADRIGGIAAEMAPQDAGKGAKVAQFSDFYRSSAGFLRGWAQTLDSPAAKAPQGPDRQETDDHE
ncbi:GbsR/MarR family transcriptional regulator [Pseudooceanicola sp. MF1-13]|uniref:GbsR/MarR family transcriptional regulator n=1 Tax=Pseudooceanicola sp. MF1-13 TaxID=3379095 RepID=UPI003891912C